MVPTQCNVIAPIAFQITAYTHCIIIASLLMDNSGPPPPPLTSRTETVFVLLATLYLGLALSWCSENVLGGKKAGREGGREEGKRGGRTEGAQVWLPGSCAVWAVSLGWCVPPEGFTLVRISQGSGSSKVSLLLLWGLPPAF